MILRSRTLRLRRVRDDVVIAEVTIKPNKTEELYTTAVEDFAKARTRLNTALATACVLPGLRQRVLRPPPPPSAIRTTAVLNTRPDKAARGKRRAAERQRKVDCGRSLVQVQQKRTACPVSNRTVRRSVTEPLTRKQTPEVDSCATTSIDSAAPEVADSHKKGAPRKKTRRNTPQKIAGTNEHVQRSLGVYTQATFLNDLLRRWLHDNTQVRSNDGLVRSICCRCH